MSQYVKNVWDKLSGNRWVADMEYSACTMGNLGPTLAYAIFQILRG